MVTRSTGFSDIGHSSGRVTELSSNPPAGIVDFRIFRIHPQGVVRADNGKAQASPVVRLGTTLLRWPALTGFVRGPWPNQPSSETGIADQSGSVGVVRLLRGYHGHMPAMPPSMTIPGPLAQPVSRPGRVHHPDLSLLGGLPRRRGRSSRPSQK